MEKEQRDLAWQCLPKEVRDKIRKDIATHLDGDYYKGWQESLINYFDHHNLTSDEEPSELLFVERAEVQNLIFSLQYRLEALKSKPIPENVGRKHDFVVSEIGSLSGAISNLKFLFGDKCLPDKENTPKSGELKPDKEPSVQVEPKLNVGDMALVIDGFAQGSVITIMAVNDEPPISYKSDIRDNGIAQWFLEDMLEPYTEPSNVSDNETMNETKDNMEEKELDIYEMLESCGDVEKIYSVIHDAEVDFKLSNRYIEFMGLSYYSNGSMYDVAGRCMLYPSRALYEKYPLDPAKAWQEWAEERKPKRWRARRGERYYWIGCDLNVESDLEEENGGDNDCYDCGNYFRTEEEAEQASEAVRECLAKFHESVAQTK